MKKTKTNFFQKILCFFTGHIQRWSVDDADDFCQRCDKDLRHPEDQKKDPVTTEGNTQGTEA